MKVNSPSVLTALSRLLAVLGANTPVTVTQNLVTLDCGLVVPGQLFLIQAALQYTKDATPGTGVFTIGKDSGAGTLVFGTFTGATLNLSRQLLANEATTEQLVGFAVCTVGGTFVMNLAATSTVGTINVAQTSTGLSLIRINR